MTDAGFASQGVEVTSREEVTHNGLPAILVEGRQDAGQGRGVFGKVFLVTGSEAASALVMGTYPAGDDELRAMLSDALESVIYDPDRPVDPNEALSFTLEPVAPLRPAGVVGNAAGYNTSGQLPSADPLEPTLLVAPSMGAVPVGDIEAFARQRLAQTPQLIEPAIEEVSDVTIGDLQGVEILATAGDDDDPSQKLFVYQVLVVNEAAGGYVLMTGIARESEREEVITAFRESSRTFQFKP